MPFSSSVPPVPESSMAPAPPTLSPPSTFTTTTTTTTATTKIATETNTINPQEETTILYEETYHPPFLWALGLIPPLLPFFWNYHVKVTDTQLEFGYSTEWTSKVVVDRHRTIQSVHVIPQVHGLWEWGGWGLRYKWTKERGGEWGYIPKNGPGICISVITTDPSSTSAEPTTSNHTATASYTFLCNEAELVAKLLRTNRT